MRLLLIALFIANYSGALTPLYLVASEAALPYFFSSSLAYYLILLRPFASSLMLPLNAVTLFISKAKFLL